MRLIMSSVVVVMLCLASGIAAAAQSAQVALPAAVKAAFAKAYPKATIKNVSKETVAGKDEYEIESMDDGKGRDLVYRPDGTLISYEEEVDKASVPEVVVKAILTRYPKATIGRCERFFQNNVMQYEIQITGAPVAEVELTPTGVWISPKK